MPGLTQNQWNAIKRIAKDAAKAEFASVPFVDFKAMIEAGFQSSQACAVINMARKAAQEEAQNAAMKAASQPSVKPTIIGGSPCLEQAKTTHAIELGLSEVNRLIATLNAAKDEAKKHGKTRFRCLDVMIHINARNRLCDFPMSQTPDGTPFYMYLGEWRRASEMHGFGIKP